MLGCIGGGCVLDGIDTEIADNVVLGFGKDLVAHFGFWGSEDVIDWGPTFCRCQYIYTLIEWMQLSEASNIAA